MIRFGPVKVIVGRSNPELGRAVCRQLGMQPARTTLSNFADGEIIAQPAENMRGRDVFIIQTTRTADDILELLFLVDACRRASAARVTIVFPYYGYSKSDRKDHSRAGISAKTIATVVEAVGADRAVCFDLHAGQIQGFFNIPMDHLYCRPCFLTEAIRTILRESGRSSKIIFASGDVSGAKLARSYRDWTLKHVGPRSAHRISKNLVIIDKTRKTDVRTKVNAVIGDPDGHVAVVVDDMIDTAGTAMAGAKSLVDRGADGAWILASHLILPKDTAEKVQEDSHILGVWGTDTIRHPAGSLPPKFHVSSIASLAAEAIRRIHGDRSVSMLFQDRIGRN